MHDQKNIRILPFAPGTEALISGNFHLYTFLNECLGPELAFSESGLNHKLNRDFIMPKKESKKGGTVAGVDVQRDGVKWDTLVYCQECGEPVDECECGLMNDTTPELNFDEDMDMLREWD